MPVSVNVDTYNFQKYGIWNGVVILVSPNNIMDERQGPVYEVYTKPENSTLMVEGEEHSIKIGIYPPNR